MTKKRVTLYVDADVHNRLKALVDSIPGMTISGVFDELVGDFLPAMETLVDMAKEGDVEAQAQMMRGLLADQMLSLADEGMATVRQFGKKGEMKE